jgi:N-hydroxyarylamine O-acetyltransferase
MSAAFDLEADFDRIHYSGEASPTLEVLRQLNIHHAETIPFENLNPLLGRPVLLDVVSLQEKLVHSRRGGYCYEQNHLFRHALENIGFKTTGLAARVLWNIILLDPIGLNLPASPELDVVLQRLSRLPGRS